MGNERIKEKREGLKAAIGIVREIKNEVEKERKKIKKLKEIEKKEKRGGKKKEEKCTKGGSSGRGWGRTKVKQEKKDKIC